MASAASSSPRCRPRLGPLASSSRCRDRRPRFARASPRSVTRGAINSKSAHDGFVNASPPATFGSSVENGVGSAGTTADGVEEGSAIIEGSAFSPRRRTRLDEYLRLVEEPDGSWELQSATAVFRGCVVRQPGETTGGSSSVDRPPTTEAATRGGASDTVEVTLVSTVHVGEASYYAGLQEEAESSFDCVLFELITAEENTRRGRAPARRGTTDECTNAFDASDEGPAETVNDEEENDAEFLPVLAVRLAPTEEARALAGMHGLSAQLDALDFRRDRWFVADMPKEEAGERRGAAASRAGRGGEDVAVSLPPALEALMVTARGRAGGGPVRQTARAMCWLVPCPEAHLLLLDWVWGGGRPAPVLGAMLDALAGGDLTAARRLAFAQMIVSSQAKGSVGGGAEVPVLVTRRNEVAMECLRKALSASDVSRVGLLYGGLHMPGLAKSVVEDLGLEPVDQRWRAVWRVEAPNRSPIVRWLALPVLLAVDGTDWAATLSEAVGDFGNGFAFSALATFGLYVVRHGALYYALGKWVLEWNKQLFDGSWEEGSRGVRG